MVLITLQRTEFQAERTFGRLQFAWHLCSYEYHTLEDKVRAVGEKVFGRTAIPVGIYDLQITFSQRFQRDMPLIMNVPNFVGVRIHTGNTEKDTDGCVLIGRSRTPSQILYSRAANEEFVRVMREIFNEKNHVKIEVRN